MFNFKAIVFLNILQLFLVSVHATKTDSLINLLNKSDDSTRMLLYKKITSELMRSNADSALIILNEAINFATKKGDDNKKIEFLISLGSAYEHIGDIEKSKEYYKTSYNYSIESNNIKLAVLALNNLGAIFIDQGYYDKASGYLFKALTLAEANSLLKRQAYVLNNIGLLFHNQQDYDKAIEYYQKSLEIRNNLNDMRGVALIYNNIGISYYFKGIIDSVLVSFKRSLDIYIQLDDKKGQTRPLFNIGEIYATKGDYEKAMQYYNKCLAIEKQIGYKIGYANTLVQIGRTYAEIEEFDKGLKYQHEGLAMLKFLNMPNEVMKAFETMYETFELIGNTDSALHYYKGLTQLKDSLFTLDKIKQINELEAIYKTEKKEKEILQLEKQRERNRIYFIILISIIILLLMLTGFIIVLSRLKAKATIEKTLAREQTKQFKAVIEAQENERKRIAGELHDSVGPLLSLADLYISDITDSSGKRKEDEKEMLEKSQKVLHEACDEVRSISHNLMPGVLIKLGLVSAIKELVAKVNATNQFKITLLDNKIQERFPESIEINIYRVFQELLNNIIRHADATEISVELSHENGYLNLKVADNGKGLDPKQIKDASGIGWKSIYSRLSLIGGEVRLESKSTGTRISISSPI